MPEDQHSGADLALTAENFRELLEAAPFAVVMVNDRGQIVIVSGQAEAAICSRRSLATPVWR